MRNDFSRDHHAGVKTIVNLLFALALTAFGSFGLFNQLRELSRALASRHWPTGEAVILSAAVHERRGSRGRTLFEPVVQFRYTFQGADFLGYRLAFGDVTARARPEAEQVASRFSPGSIWAVSICKRRPELAVIHAGPTRNLWFAVCFFSGYTALSVAFLIDAYRKV